MSSIWFKKDLALSDFEKFDQDTMNVNIGIRFTELGPDFLKGTMPVDHRTKQPYGFLHGGASCVLAETLGSFASTMVIDTEKYLCMGLEINANHIRSVKSGIVTGIVSPLHLGSSTHVWDIKINDEREKLICVSRLTVAILKKPSA